MTRRFAVAILSVIFCSAPFTLAQEKTRATVLNLSSGSVLVEYSGEYGGNWMALNLFDGNPATGWSSPQNKPNGNYFIIELPQRYALTSIVLDNTGDQEPGYPGISSRSIEIWISTTAPDSGFRKLTTVETAKGARKEFPLPAGTEVEWLKLAIASNWGNKEYTELMKVEAYGHPAGPIPQRQPISGVYNTNYGPLALEQKGPLITGCYYQGTASVNGSTDGRTANMEWRQNGNRTGSVLMVLNSRGDFLNGVWYENGVMAGTWFGKRDPNNHAVCDPNGVGSLANSMKNSGRAVLYGIHFNSDSAVLQPESDSTLQEVASLLKSQPTLRVTLEGYTDSTNTDAYNLDLSKRRAQSAVQWLTAHGISVDRLMAQGYGKARPVADNNTPQGRALNRRVEIVALK